MYAYRQVSEEVVREGRLHVVEPSRRHAIKKLTKSKQSKKRVKKLNPIVYIFNVTLLISFFVAFLYFVFPSVFNTLTKQVFLTDKIEGINSPVVSGENLAEKGVAKISAPDVYSIMCPAVNYVNNDMFLNRLMLTKTVKKVHSEITTMYQTSEMSGLKKQLQGLMAQYPSIKPAIYVWEYENGKYIDINADKQYSAASIIKLPVLVRMFKSIEAKQMTIYDEMTLTDYYRASGSGTLQYSASGTRLSLDALAKTMIQDSDNSATNMIMAKMGGMDDVNIGLRDWGISKTYVRTWLPDLKGTNKTTAMDMAKILYNLDNPGFLNINSREYIIDYMSHVKNNKLIAAGLGSGAMFVHKTGDIGSMLGDAGIVYAPNGKKYIIVILANRPYNAPQGKDFIVQASSLIYKSIVG